MLRVRDILQTKGAQIWSIAPKATAYEALVIMAEKNVGALLVIDGEMLVGIFSERDYARKLILKGKHSKETPVEELMTSDVYSVTPDETVDECMKLMTVARCRHMPVLENDQLVGIVTIGDIVNATISQQKVAIQDLENYIAGGYYKPAPEK